MIIRTALVGLALVITAGTGTGTDPHYGARLSEPLPEPSTIERVAHPADSCLEDQAYVPVDYRDPIGVEDIRGVTRACVNIDELAGRLELCER